MIKGLILGLTLLLTSCLPIETQRLSRLMDSALLLKFDGGKCSGTAVGKDLVLSAAHCFGESTLLEINGSKAEVLEVITDGRDSALVRVSIEFERWAKVNPALPVRGDPLSWLGNPGELEFAYRQGYVVIASPEYIYIDAPGFNGDSGAGLMNDKGEIIGVISGATVWTYQMSMQLVISYPIAFSDKQLRGEF